MSETATQPDDPTAWLTRNADHINPETAREGESWDRAKRGASDANIVDGDRGLGRQAVALPDGEEIHETLLVQSPNGDLAGACDCDGWRMGDSACAHLCTLLALDGLDIREIPTSGQYVSELMSSNAEEVTEEREAAESDVPDTQEPHPSDQPRVPRERSDAFAEPLPDVDDQYVMDMGGDTYIRKAGYARLLKQQGYRVNTVVEQYAHEGDEKRAVVMANIMDADGDLIAQNVGTAGPPEAEDMDGAEWNLDELAVTRAWTRAAAIATGEGMTALAEVHPGEEEW